MTFLAANWPIEYGITGMGKSYSDVNGAETAAGNAPKRSAYPRYGSFVTIAAALLILFGAASRMGNVPETAALFGIDMRNEGMLRQEEERQRARQMIGTTTPVLVSSDKPPSVHLDEDVLPPSRRGVAMNMASRQDAAPPGIIPMDDGYEGGRGGPVPTPPLMPPTVVRGGERQMDPEPVAEGASHYTVKQGDTWFKIARNLLGDGNRWQELLRANPGVGSSDLRVGLELRLPGGGQRR